MNGVIFKVLLLLFFAACLSVLAIFIYSFIPPSEPRSGEEIVMTFCKSCHLHGTTGAPQIGDKDAWYERKIKGIELLTNHAMEGFQGMPARGTCLNCTELEIKRAIEYMIEKSS